MKTLSWARLRRAFLVAALCLAVPIVPFVVLGELPGDRWLSAHDGGALSFGALGAALLALDVALPIPSSLVGTMLGARLGFAAGFVWTFAGLLAGNVAGYAGGRLAARRPRRAAAADDDPRARSTSAPTAVLLFVSRPVPVLAEAVAIAAGATRMAPAVFVALAAAGNALYAAVLCASASALLPEGLALPALVVPMFVPVAGWALWRLRGRGR